MLNREIFLSFEEACWVIDRWRLDYNHHRIHSSLDYQTPAAYAAGCVLPASATPRPPEHNRFTNPNSLTQPSAKTGGSHSGARTAIVIQLVGFSHPVTLAMKWLGLVWCRIDSV
ncbi:MAG: hypothetical protein CMM01_26685 [Rhodopirellula sp.]|nr:hypothetical protein [Rhodopirellula sp.]